MSDDLKYCQGTKCQGTISNSKTELKELKEIRLIKLEEEVVSIMAWEIFAL